MQHAGPSLNGRKPCPRAVIRSGMSAKSPTIEQLRRYAVTRSLFAPTTLARAVAKIGFVQADPIRAPARAQDLILRQRVKGYRSGDLERRYPRLGLEEGFFVNYGFLSREAYGWMHPRVVSRTRVAWTAKNKRRADQLLAFVDQRGAVHPREVDALFDHGRVENYWGGMSKATTHLLQAMHYRGMLRISRRDDGIRIYAVHAHPSAAIDAGERDRRLDALLDLAVSTYAPLPSATLVWLVNRLRWGAPQWAGQLKAAVKRARERLAHARIDGVDWYWPASERPSSPRHRTDERVRLLAPFDPIVWDRKRFELFWGWSYRFEAYTPAKKRKLGYYALPMLWRDQVIGWGNASVQDGRLSWQLGFERGRPQEAAFARALDDELASLQAFL